MTSVVTVAHAQAPTITAISAPRQVVNLGQSVTLSVTATGATSYQWKRNGRNVPGGTAASLLIANAQPVLDGGWYQVIVSNTSGSTRSATVFVNVAIVQAQILAWGSNTYGQITAPGGLQTLAGLVAGGYHNLALRGDGTVVGWGQNSFSQTTVPGGLTDVVAVAAGNGHSLALKSDGTVVAWGYNGFGQATVPGGLIDVVALGAGDYHSFAVKSDGTLVMWGLNDGGQATLPAGLADVISATGGDYHSVALKGSGSVVTWGNSFGAGIPPAETVTAIAANGYHNLALRPDGSVTAWANNSNGESVVPAGLANVVALAAGDFHSAALKSDGTTVAWGSNSSGQTAVPGGLANVVLLGAGALHTVVVRSTSGDAPPTIATQPTDRLAPVGQAVTFAVGVSGTAPFSFNWRKNGATIATTTSGSLTLSNVQPADAGAYDVVVSNYLGTATSNAATLTVQVAPPVITTQPVNQVASFGSTVSFFVFASSPVTATYQWRKDGSPITNATSNTLTLSNIQTPSLGSYDVVVTNSGGSVTSLVATLSLLAPPAIGTQPASVVANIPANVTFTVGVSSGLPVTYQWRKNGAPIAGATSATLALFNVLAADGGSYDVLVSNSAGSVLSLPATLSLRVLLNPPASRSVGIGGTTVFSVTATGTPPFTYQWRKDGVTVAGATNSTLGLTPLGVEHAGDYTVVVTNAHGSETTPPATLTILPNPIAYSSRQFVGPAGVTGHFVIDGAAPKRLLLRAVGPSLGLLGVSGGLLDPQIALLDANNQVIATNDNWGSVTSVNWSSLFSQVGALAFPVGSKDAALYATLNPGAYSVRITGVSGAIGVAMLELFDTDKNPTSRLAYVGVRGRVGAPLGPVVGGLTIANSASKRVLMRAVSSVLGAGALANPQLQVIDGTVLYTANDDWGGTSALNFAAAQAGAFALANGSTDAAVLIDTRVGSGVYAAQIPSGTGSGDTLLEFYDIGPGGTSTVAPVFVVSPTSQSLATGENVTLRALATGSAVVTYQWRKNGLAVTGATTTTLALNAAQSGDAGNYDIVATNAVGSATSAPATIAVMPAGMGATHVLGSAGYFAGSNITISNTLTFAGTPESLGWRVTLPPGWIFSGSSGGVGDVQPASGATGSLEWAWTTPPASPVTFSYSVFAPVGTTGPQVISAVAIVRSGGTTTQFNVQPEPLRVDQVALHTADTDFDNKIGLFELTRVIELYNTRNGTVRTGAYKIDPSGEDGFAGDPARASSATVVLSRYHSADTAAGSGGAPDGKINLTELTRVIELYNFRSGTVRTGQYHVQLGTEDGFAAGP